MTSQRKPDCDRLVEKIPGQFVERWRDATVFAGRLVIGAIGAIWVPIIAAVVWLPFRDQEESLQLLILILALLACSLAWGLGVYAVGAFTRANWAEANLPVVDFRDDVVTLRWRREVIRAKVAECNIRIGRAWMMKYARLKANGLVPFGERDVILIDFPPLYRDILGCVRSKTTAAVGYTDESRLQWTAALGVIEGESSDTPDSPSKVL